MKSVKVAYITVGMVTDEIDACCDDKAHAIISEAVHKAVQGMVPKTIISDLSIEIVEARKL